jgi:Domain of unknown function (DUF4416)
MQPRPVVPCLLVVAAFSRHAEALAWAREQLATRYGPVGLDSPTYDFHHTTYYAPAMGTGLQKQLLAFERLVSPDVLPAIKLETNALEEGAAKSGRWAEPRPLNLDPGLLNLGKFLLASTKDQAHRIYLRDGIFAEVTLFFRDGAFEPWPWTYADYREPGVRETLRTFREYYRRQLTQPVGQ